MQPVVLYTAPTPNGFKTSILTEELKAIYKDKTGFDVVYKAVDLGRNEQKEEWFEKMNPNGRIPTLYDPNYDFAVFESAAIVQWLADRYDVDHVLSFAPGTIENEKLRSEILQWANITQGGIGPMQGQSNHFFRYAPEKIPYGINRYQNETKRLYKVLDAQLSKSEYLVGGKYTIADIISWPWPFYAPWAGVYRKDVPAGTMAWIERIRARPAVEAGLKQPTGKIGDTVKHMWDDDFEESQKEANEAKAKAAQNWIVTANKDDFKK